MIVLTCLLATIRNTTSDRVVLVSNSKKVLLLLFGTKVNLFVQTLDIFQQMCEEIKYPFLRLDGDTALSARQKMVDDFNQPGNNLCGFSLLTCFSILLIVCSCIFII